MIVSFGAVNVDLIYSVQNHPEKGETVVCPEYQARIGGKGANQAMAAHLMGAETRFYGAVGQDAFAQMVVEAFDKKQLWSGGLRKSELPTGTASVAVDLDGENRIIVAAGANNACCAADIPDSVLDSDTFVLSQLEVPLEQTYALFKRAHSRGATTILSFAPARNISLDILDFVSIIVLNVVEMRQFSEIVGLKEKNLDPVSLAMELGRYLKKVVVVTLGQEGAFLYSPRAGSYKVSALEIDPVDTTGAGDAFCGIFTAGLDAGDDMEEALKAAAIGSGLTCLKLGAQEALPTKDDLLSYKDKIKLNKIS